MDGLDGLSGKNLAAHIRRQVPSTTDCGLSCRLRWPHAKRLTITNGIVRPRLLSQFSERNCLSLHPNSVNEFLFNSPKDWMNSFCIDSNKLFLTWYKRNKNGHPIIPPIMQQHIASTTSQLVLGMSPRFSQ